MSQRQDELKELEKKRELLRQQVEHQKKVKKIQDEIDALHDELDDLKGKKRPQKDCPKKDSLEDFFKKIKKEPFENPYKEPFDPWKERIIYRIRVDDQSKPITKRLSTANPIPEQTIIIY